MMNRNVAFWHNFAYAPVALSTRQPKQFGTLMRHSAMEPNGVVAHRVLLPVARLC
jgi:hypothetical protein